ncbi:hypothetical protein A2696_02185 [Candidatus Curtissbacteria bacterium RIFCSPHIGHO2_01_FULL_41_13]|uniref:Uncharacterized protein n=1 Tax=Candidatus Curtissbacteria bacterium RIFCSPHIGHO2_01_FULL_41_13 TaxID=1797745 RepID=A0A1F5G275_9BACT|nr:MAG: hypothetical protein A2696_02185 [Candidatus Curtissbacteria bacterium RIFCSPHIGHO2_01_FULL_41_13]
MNSVRPELLAAYRRTFGGVRTRGAGKERNLEGIRITLFTKSRTQLIAPYEASIIPLYLDN